MMKYVLVLSMWKFVIISIFCYSSCSCYPTKPLNERAADLTWEAWLLVDDHNQDKQSSDTVLRRRITPKSVFIAPTFRPESLPACAEGYSSDHLGRCIKIIKLDQDAHKDFLIQKLREKFNPSDYDDDYYEEETSTPGPFQLNIPLGVQSDQADDTVEESDVAIIVSPTKPQFIRDLTDKEKRSDIADQEAQEAQLKQLVETSTSTSDIITTVQPPNETLSTIFVETDSTQPVTTTTEEVDTVTETVANTELVTEIKLTSTPSQKPLDPSVKYTRLDLFPTESKSKTPVQTQTMSHDVNGVVTTQSTPSDTTTVRDTKTVKTTLTSDYAVVPSQISPTVSHTSRAIHYSKQADEHIVDFDVNNSRDTTRSKSQENLNRRNRDKNNGLFFLPPRWTDSNYQRPVVLRFSRKHAYLDMEQFNKPNFYRSIPTDDFAYLFKFKHKQSDQR